MSVNELLELIDLKIEAKHVELELVERLYDCKDMPNEVIRGLEEKAIEACGKSLDIEK